MTVNNENQISLSSNFKATKMSIELIIRDQIVEAIESCYEQKIDQKLVQLQNTRKEFEGDITLVVFPFVRMSKKSPEQTAADIGDYLQKNVAEVEKYNVVKGFLNLVISTDYWISLLNDGSIRSKIRDY